jgi:hypothetical protein
LAHITFIHGIANKPRKDVLLEQWRVALLDDDGLDLDALGVTTSMAYWADVLYAEPAPDEAATESTAFELQASVEPQDDDLGWLAEAPAAEQDFVGGLAAKVGLVAVAASATAAGSTDGVAVAPGGSLEAVPLPLWLTKRLMKVFLRDVHHYLYDATSEPRPGTRFQVRQEVRARAVAALAEAAGSPGPHVVVCHSLGTVVAYDVLTALADVAQVDALVTLGSPLGISEVQQALAPPWTSADGWPARTLPDGPWLNVADRLDPVCGPDPSIANQYRRGGQRQVLDVHVKNPGSWRHGVAKYLAQPALRDALAQALGGPR